MAAPNANPFALTPPRRPGADDFNGMAKTNAVDRPDPRTQPNAEEWNTKGHCLVAYGGVVPVAILTVRFNAGAPLIDKVACANPALLAGDFTVTDNAAGDTSISWLATKLPTAVADAEASVTEDVEIDRVRAYATTVGGNPGVRVKTKLGAVGTDARFVVKIY